MSEHFSMRELTRSDYAARNGLRNEPMPRITENIEQVLMPGLEEVRALLKHPMQVSSGFRSQSVNTAVGGRPDSQHRYGLAADFHCDGFGAPSEIVLAIATSAIPFDQLIEEFGEWVHISFVRRSPRRQVLYFKR
jgi:uncharacterized protein YcbK (DUF882 family)